MAAAAAAAVTPIEEGNMASKFGNFPDHLITHFSCYILEEPLDSF
jgi:hypothetical protein